MSSPASSTPTSGPASLLPLISGMRVSSVLNGDVLQYGKQHLVDGSPDSCWNSEQGSPQQVQLTFARPVHVHSATVTFQGGFVGKVRH